MRLSEKEETVVGECSGSGGGENGDDRGCGG